MPVSRACQLLLIYPYFSVQFSGYLTSLPARSHRPRYSPRDCGGTCTTFGVVVRAFIHVRLSRANKRRCTGWVLVKGGRLTWRLKMMSGCRRSALAGKISDLLGPRSERVCSGKEQASGLVQRAKREESASKQPSFSRRKWVKIRAITKTSP